MWKKIDTSHKDPLFSSMWLVQSECHSKIACSCERSKKGLHFNESVCLVLERVLQSPQFAKYSPKEWNNRREKLWTSAIVLSLFKHSFLANSCWVSEIDFRCYGRFWHGKMRYKTTLYLHRMNRAFSRCGGQHSPLLCPSQSQPWID